MMRAIGGVAAAFLLLLLLVILIALLPGMTVMAQPSQVQLYQKAASKIDGLAWQELLAIDAVLRKQNFDGVTQAEVDALAHRFLRPCDEEKNKTCRKTYTFEEMMDRLGFTDEEKEWARELLRSGVLDDLADVGSTCVAGDAGVWSPNPLTGWTWPLPGYYTVTSCYGPRVDPVELVDGFHFGLDVGAPEGTPIQAAKDGVVILAGWAGTYGNTVVLDHGEDGTTRYAHMSQITVALGQRVRAGEVVGYVGSTGKSTGPHLHFEWAVGGRHYDPITLFR